MQSERESARRSPDSSWLRESGAPALAPVPSPPGMPARARPVVPLRPADDGAGMAIAGFVLGISSVFLAFFGVCDLPFGITGVVLGVLGLRSIRRHDLAIAGVVLSAIGFLLSIGATIFWLYLFGAFR
jgi:Domain of unknown function (DUF4190)